MKPSPIHPAKTQFLRRAFVIPLFLAFALAAGKEYSALPEVSTLTYSLKHPMHLIRGQSEKVSCTVNLAEDTTASLITCSSRVADFNSGNENRDSHMLEVVDGLRYPEVKFTGHPVKQVNGGWLIDGDLSFHGLIHPISFRVNPTYSEGTVRIQGEFPVSLTAYQIKRPSLLLVKTEDTVHIALDIRAPFP